MCDLQIQQLLAGWPGQLVVWVAKLQEGLGRLRPPMPGASCMGYKTSHPSCAFGNTTNHSTIINSIACPKFHKLASIPARMNTARTTIRQRMDTAAMMNCMQTH